MTKRPIDLTFGTKPLAPADAQEIELIAKRVAVGICAAGMGNLSRAWVNAEPDAQ